MKKSLIWMMLSVAILTSCLAWVANTWTGSDGAAPPRVTFTAPDPAKTSTGGLATAAPTTSGALIDPYFNGANGGVWDANTTAIWSLNTGGPYSLTWTAAGGGANAQATFEGTATNVTVNGNVNMGAITFTTDGYTIGGGGTLTLGSMANAVIMTGASGIDTISAILAGSGGITKGASGGTLTLSGANTYTGPTKILQGQLILNHATGPAIQSTDVTFDNNLSPDLYTFQDNQFGPGTVVSFINDVGDHGRFELDGTVQTVAGIQTVGYSTIRGIVQNCESSVNNPGTSMLILNGSGNYTFGGYLRNQTGVIGLTKNGAGTQTLSGYWAYQFGGPTIINAGKLLITGNNYFCNMNTGYLSLPIASGATFEFASTAADMIMVRYGATVFGAGTYRVNSSYRTYWSWDYGLTVAMASGGLIDVNSGTLALAYGSSINSSRNLADLNVASGAVFDMWDCSQFTIDGLTGQGQVEGSGANVPLSMGNDNGNATFDGVLFNRGAAALVIAKYGSGNQVFTGPNTYTGRPLMPVL